MRRGEGECSKVGGCENLGFGRGRGRGRGGKGEGKGRERGRDGDGDGGVLGKRFILNWMRSESEEFVERIEGVVVGRERR